MYEVMILVILAGGKTNSGFSEGYNQAIKLCETKYSLILGPDCIIQQKDINLLLKVLFSD